MKLLLLSLLFGPLLANASIQGTYNAVLEHDQGYHQFATITLRTLNSGGNLKISANVRIFFGDTSSNEFLIYDYPDCSFNILTGQLAIKNDNSDVVLVGNLKNEAIQGEWFASSAGRVGAFNATKQGTPPAPSQSTLIESITGNYKGKLTNTNQNSNLPEKAAMSLVTTQDPSNLGTNVKVSGNLRFYLGEFDSNEYIETKFSQVDFNFYSRYLTAKTQEYGMTIKGVIGLDGVFKGDIFADGLGQVGKLELEGQ